MFRTKLTVLIQKLASYFTPTLPTNATAQEAARYLSFMDYYPYFS
jgi:hypothetical protein